MRISIAAGEQRNFSLIVTHRYRIKQDERETSVPHVGCSEHGTTCCQTKREAQRAQWPTAFDFVKLVTGAGTKLSVHSDTLGAITSKFEDTASPTPKPPNRHRRFPGVPRSPRMLTALMPRAGAPFPVRAAGSALRRVPQRIGEPSAPPRRRAKRSKRRRGIFER
jgi:hypothetical protein